MFHLTAQRGIAEAGPPRTSSLLAPIMLLTGHEGEIYTVKFHPEGMYMASAGFDRQIYLWNVYGECENFAVLKGHAGAVIELQFSTDGTTIFTASTGSCSICEYYSCCLVPYSFSDYFLKNA